MLRVYIAAAAAALAVIAALGVIAIAQERKIAALTAEKETLSANLAAARDSLRKSDEAAKHRRKNGGQNKCPHHGKVSERSLP